MVGQTIWAYATTKISRLQSNEIIKLGLVNFFVLYCGGNPEESSKSKQNLVAGFQINLIWVYPNQIDHLKVLRGGIWKNWEFDLP